MATQFSVKDNLPWKTRFFTIWSVQALSLLGSMLVRFVLIWYVTVQSAVLITHTLIYLLVSIMYSLRPVEIKDW